MKWCTMMTTGRYWRSEKLRKLLRTEGDPYGNSVPFCVENIKRRCDT